MARRPEEWGGAGVVPCGVPGTARGGACGSPSGSRSGSGSASMSSSSSGTRSWRPSACAPELAPRALSCRGGGGGSEPPSTASEVLGPRPGDRPRAASPAAGSSRPRGRRLRRWRPFTRRRSRGGRRGGRRDRRWGCWCGGVGAEGAQGRTANPRSVGPARDSRCAGGRFLARRSRRGGRGGRSVGVSAIYFTVSTEALPHRSPSSTVPSGRTLSIQ